MFYVMHTYDLKIIIRNFSNIGGKPTQLLYNEDQVECDWPERVECGDRPECDEDNQDCEDHHITTEKPSDFNCPAEYGYFADPKNCIYYYHCDADTAVRLKCQKSMFTKKFLNKTENPSTTTTIQKLNPSTKILILSNNIN